jgi:hypothetical protein
MQYEKLLAAASKVEKHVQYQDITYLSFPAFDDQAPCVLELNDTGMEHTGAREMAIRKADAVILCYSANDHDSFEQLSGVLDDFASRKTFVRLFLEKLKNCLFQPYVLLMANEDPLGCENEAEEDEEHREISRVEVLPEADDESTSEGYGSSGS